MVTCFPTKPEITAGLEWFVLRKIQLSTCYFSLDMFFSTREEELSRPHNQTP